MGASAGMFARRPAGDQRQAEAGAGEKKAEAQTEQGMHQPQHHACRQGCTDRDRSRHEDAQVEGIERINIGRQPEKQPCGTMQQGASRTLFGKAAKQPFAQGGEHAERCVMGRKPFAIARGRTDDGEQANAG